MSERPEGVSDGQTISVFNMVCPAGRQAGCSLRTAAIAAGPRINGLKESMTDCEAEIFLSLARGHRIVVRDHETGRCGAGGLT